jgi:putative addiction module component (TIGR02574 family)
MNRVTEIYSRALELPEEDRADLVQRLLLTLQPGDDATFDERWRDEIESRLASVRNGTTVLSDWSDAAARIRQALAERKSP